MANHPQVSRPLLRRLVQSPYLDLAGSLLVVVLSIIRGFQGTIYHQGEIQMHTPIDQLPGLVMQGAYPLGVMAILGAVLSLMSTRLTGKQNNLGNVLNVASAVNSGANDFLFGNGSALITYPVTFFIASYAVARWSKGEVVKKRDAFYYWIVAICMVVGFGLVYLGAQLFGGRTDLGFLIVVAITFGLSMGANLATAFKYDDTWLSWTIYNIVQFIKNLMLGNFANLIKYAFYLFNAVITLGDWKFNGDRHTTQILQSAHLKN